MIDCNVQSGPEIVSIIRFSEGHTSTQPFYGTNLCLGLTQHLYCSSQVVVCNCQMSNVLRLISALWPLFGALFRLLSLSSNMSDTAKSGIELFRGSA